MRSPRNRRSWRTPRDRSRGHGDGACADCPRRPTGGGGAVRDDLDPGDRAARARPGRRLATRARPRPRALPGVRRARRTPRGRDRGAPGHAYATVPADQRAETRPADRLDAAIAAVRLPRLGDARRRADRRVADPDAPHRAAARPHRLPPTPQRAAAPGRLREARGRQVGLGPTRESGIARPGCRGGGGVTSVRCRGYTVDDDVSPCPVGRLERVMHAGQVPAGVGWSGRPTRRR